MRLHEIADDEVPNEDTNLTPAYKDTAEIKASAYPALRAKIDKAARLKLPPIALTITSEKYKDVESGESFDTGVGAPDHNTVKEKYYDVKIEGAAPQVAGYKFMATIQHKDGGNIIRTVPGQENNENIQQFYEARPDYCDHCHKRRNRIDTFIVKGNDGQLRQVGRNCLADFLGGQDPKQILWYFSLRDLVNRAVSESDEETMRFGRHRELGVSPKRVLSAAAAIIRTYGYQKNMHGEEGYGREPTSRKVRWAIFDRKLPTGHNSHEFREERKALLKVADNPTSEDQDLVNKAVEWFNAIPQEEKNRSEFFHNIEVLLRSEAVTPRDVGFLGAIFPAYHRATAQAKEKTEQATKKNETIGVVGEKLPPTEVTVVSTQNIQSNYGTTQLCRMEDNEGRLLVWFNSGGTRLEANQKLTIVGTIKKHDEFKGRHQTILARVKEYSANPEKVVTPKPAKPAPEMKWDLGSSAESQPTQSTPAVRTPRPEGGQSKTAMAMAKFQEFSQANGRSPSLGEFKSMVAGDPFNMGPQHAQTTYYGIKKKVAGSLGENFSIGVLDKFRELIEKAQ